MAPNSLPSRSQLMFSLLYSMIPLLGFWLLEKYHSIEAGIIAAAVLGVGEVLWVYIREKRWEQFAVWSAVLVIVMGLISWQTGSTVFIRLKPAIFEGIFALLFIISSLLGKPFMLILARRQFKNEAMFNAITIRYFGGLNLRLGILFLLHTIVTVYAAIWLSLDAWAFVKGVLFYILFAVFFAVEFVYSRLWHRKRIEQEMRQREFLEYQKNIVENMRRRK